MDAIERIVSIYGRQKRFDLSEGLLASVKDQFSGDDLESIETLRLAAKRGEAARVTAEKLAAVKRGMAHAKARLAYYRKRLAVAQAAGDASKIQKLQAAIASIQGQTTP